MPYIISRLASGVDYTFYAKGPNNKQIRQGSITINGGAGVANKKTLVTPQGVVTQVTADQLKKLRTNMLFKEHEDGGFVRVLDKDPRDADKEAIGMARDESDQLTPGDYTGVGKKVPETGAVA